MAAAKKTIRPPILSNDLEPFVLDTLDAVDVERVRIENPSLSKERGAHPHFDGVKISAGTWSETRLTHLTWLDVLCERCDLSMIDWPGAKLTRVEARGSRMTGAKLAEAEISDVRFVDCQLDYASFARSRFRQVAFERCRLNEADFSEADLAGTTFIDCTMHAVDLTRAKLQGADVSRSTLGEVRVGVGDVRGLIVNRDQATVFAQLFGLVLRDP